MTEQPPNRSSALQKLALCLLAGWLFGCWGNDTDEQRPTTTAERGRIERIVVATGTIEPEHEVEVKPRISGIIEKIHVEASDQVEAGQPVIEIERELLEVQAQEAAARLEAAKVELRYARTALKRAAALRTGGALAEQELEDAEARQQAAQAAVAREQASLDSLNVQLRYATVTAPIAGKILDVYVEEGSAVSAVTSVTGGTKLLSLALADALYLQGLVDENELARIALGQAARIRTEAYADRSFDGRVREIAPIGQRQQNVTYFEVEVEITDEDAQLLRPRMSGDAEIITEIVEDALLIPETALLYDGDVIYVEALVAENSREVERRDVTIGIVDSNNVQILSGLEPGMEILLK